MYELCQILKNLRPWKSEYKDLLSLATKESLFISDATLYRQIDGVTTANVILVYHE